MTTVHNASFSDSQGANYIMRNDSVVRWGLTISTFLAIPGLTALWPMSSVQRSTGNTYDISGQGRTLTYNGNPVYRVYNSTAPYIDMDGTGDYLSRSDETDLDFLGSETINDQSGLTVGGWFWFDTVSDGINRYGLVDKFRSVGNQRSFTMFLTTTNGITFTVSGDGTNTIQVTSSTQVTTSGWYFCVGRFVPSSQVSVTVNDNSDSNSVGIPAAIFNSTSALEIGRFNGASNLDGRAALVFLSSRYLPASLVNLLFYQSRFIFGV